MSRNKDGSRGADKGAPPRGSWKIPGIKCEVVLAEVVTFRVVEVPAVMLAEVNAQVETGGQPAMVSATCPESGGAKVAIVKEADPPAVTDVVTGWAATPPGNGPAKLRTVFPPHSAPDKLFLLQSVKSKAVTMK